MTFKALLLDSRDVMVGVVELEDEAELTARHVDLRPHGGDCDNKPGEYRWDREKKQLVPLPRSQRAEGGKPTFEQAVAFDLLSRWEANAAGVCEVSLTWLDEVVQSLDFKGFVLGGHPQLLAYAQARSIKFGKEV